MQFVIFFGVINISSLPLKKRVLTKNQRFYIIFETMNINTKIFIFLDKSMFLGGIFIHLLKKNPISTSKTSILPNTFNQIIKRAIHKIQNALKKTANCCLQSSLPTPLLTTITHQITVAYRFSSYIIYTRARVCIYI